jgi:hypothetical protein
MGTLSIFIFVNCLFNMLSFISTVPYVISITPKISPTIQQSEIKARSAQLQSLSSVQYPG